MKKRHFIRAAVGLLAGAATIGLMGLPASANTVSVEVTGGDVVLNDDVGDPIQTFDLDDTTGTPCSSTNTVTTTGTTGTTPPSTSSGTFTMTLTSVTYTTMGRITFTAAVSGTWTHSTTTSGWIVVITGGSGTAVIEQATSCTNVTNPNPCTITGTNITGSGEMNTANPLSLTTGDTATVSGGNQTGETTVVGTTCGGTIAANQGNLDIVDAEVEVV